MISRLAALCRRMLSPPGRTDARSAQTGFAGAVGQELQEPLAQLQRDLQALQEALPAPHGALSPQQLESAWRSLARAEQALQRAHKVGLLLQHEAAGRPVDLPSLRPLGASDLVAEAVDACRVLHADCAERVAVEVVADFTFRGDEAACTCVVANLLRVALADTAARVTITIGKGQIRLRDTGSGIAARVTDGAGPALAHCRGVLRACGGDLLWRALPGEPAEVTLRLAALSPQEEEQHRLGAVAQARTMLAGKRVLVVDGDAHRRTATRQKLGPLALTTELEEAADAESALARLAARKVDVVLLQLGAPGAEDYALAARIRATHPEVRILGCATEPVAMARMKAAKAGIDGVVGLPCGQLRLLSMLQQVQHGSQDGRARARRLSGRRILVAVDSAFNRKAIAAHLRNAEAVVIEMEHGETVLEQLHLHQNIDAVVVDLHMPGMDGLATTRAIRSSGEPWAAVPVIALTARSDEPAVAAATAAGMNGFLVKPVEAPLLYDTLARLLTLGAVPPVGAAVPPRPPAPQEGLLNLQRLESYRRLGMLDELLSDYVPEMTRLVARLQETVDGADVQGTIAALHSLLGMSGEAGAQALYQEVRKLYVPLLEHGQWPRGGNWLPQLKELAGRTEQALKAYCAEQARSSAG